MHQALEKYAINSAICIHRLGKLKIGDMAVWVGVNAAHRDAAFQACRFIIDDIKARVPIWKKEFYLDSNSPRWLDLRLMANEFTVLFVMPFYAVVEVCEWGRIRHYFQLMGTPIIERIVNDINHMPNLCENLFICSGKKMYAQLSSHKVDYLDDYLADYQGPLSGLAAALQKISTNQSLNYQWVFSFPCDTLLLPSQTFNLFKDAIEQSPSCDMVYLRGDRDHPLHAAYRVEVAEQLFAYLNQDQRAVMPFIKQLNCQAVEIPKAWQRLP